MNNKVKFLIFFLVSCFLFAPSTKISEVNAEGSGFTAAYYQDEALTQEIPSYFPKLKAGDYYIKITNGTVFSDPLTISIDSEGTANDVDSALTTMIDGNNFKYKRTVSSDAQAVGLVPETISINGTSLSSTESGVYYIDTVAPQLTLESILNNGFDTYKMTANEPLSHMDVQIAADLYAKLDKKLSRERYLWLIQVKKGSITFNGIDIFASRNDFSLSTETGTITITRNDNDTVFSIDATGSVATAIRKQSKIPLVVRDDAANEVVTEFKVVDPASGAKTELAKITDLSLTTLPFATLNTQTDVEAAMLLLANAEITADYAATIAAGSVYDPLTNIWTGKIIVTSKTEITNTMTDLANRTITIVISTIFEIPSNSNISSIKIPAGITDPKIQFTVNNDQTLTNKEITIDDSSTGMQVVIPTGTTITGPVGWDGIVQLPRVSTATLQISGYTTDINSVIEIGLTGNSLTFDQPIKLIFPNKVGKRIGFIINGVFAEITTICSIDNLPSGANECKADAGVDLIVLTKHFTKFVVYTQTIVSTGGGGGESYYSDTTAPSISNINITNGNNSAVITWNTNESSLTWLLYGTSTIYGQENKSTSYNTIHSVALNNLLPTTTYHYQIKSRDNSGNMAVSTDQTFTTIALDKIEAIEDSIVENKAISTIRLPLTSINSAINNVPVIISNPEATPIEENIPSEQEKSEPIQNFEEEEINPINPEQASLVSTGFDFGNYLWAGLILFLIIIEVTILIKKVKKQNQEIK